MRGAQKALERLDGVDRAVVNLVKGEGQVFPKSGQSFDPVLIPKAIHDAGFTATAVEVTVEGTLVRKSDSLELNVPGVPHTFLLSGGTQMDSLKKQNDLAERKIRVTGKLEINRAETPPRLSVENFQPLP